MMIDPMSCGMPSTDHAKKPMWPAPNSSACVAAMTLTGEPSMVSLAPFRHASASGIISCDGAIPVRTAMMTVTGSRAATAPFMPISALEDRGDDHECDQQLGLVGAAETQEELARPSADPGRLDRHHDGE